MRLLYDIASYFGYFLIMMLFMGLAIGLAKRRSAWVWYIVGACLQLLSLSGQQKVASINGTDMTLEWLIFICILIIAAIIIIRRKYISGDEKE